MSAPNQSCNRWCSLPWLSAGHGRRRCSWSCHQEGGLGRVKFWLEKVDLLFPTISLVEGWEESPCDPWEEEMLSSRFWLKEKLMVINLKQKDLF
jgi:hypothetical protein